MTGYEGMMRDHLRAARKGELPPLTREQVASMWRNEDSQPDFWVGVRTDGGVYMLVRESASQAR